MMVCGCVLVLSENGHYLRNIILLSLGFVERESIIISFPTGVESTVLKVLNSRREFLYSKTHYFLANSHMAFSHIFFFSFLC
jgi:hypothetical protein